MAASNHERIGKAFTLLRDGLAPFVEREMRAEYGDTWEDRLRDVSPGRSSVGKQDAQVLLKGLWEFWNVVFKKTLGHSERSLVSELQTFRNKWAHQEAFTTDDTYRALDSMDRLLSAMSAPEADELERQKLELLRVRFDEQARDSNKRKMAAVTVQTGVIPGLKPWREVVTPHPDVASGKYQLAEFAADLWQVHQGDGTDEYKIPREFYRRTFLTEGLSTLLENGVRRLGGLSADPVIELQTNFGGGKTHSMLALYHLFSGEAATNLAGVENILAKASLTLPTGVRRAVLVGNKITPGKLYLKPDGTTVRTLWGELAWQVGGAEGYALVAEADQQGTNPGDSLDELFKRFGPVLVLIDEWVAYARQLFQKYDMPCGSFDTHFTFAQTLSEAAKRVNGTLLVVSIPTSDNEVGGDAGKVALDRLKNAIGRVESPWRPASDEETYEIVRRRLFQGLEGPERFKERDAVLRAFMEMYRANTQEFPPECKEADYERKLKTAYPIHPEMFERLYTDWSSLDKFQRTRGVLRLMAGVIHDLWTNQDKNLLIMPASLPIEEVQAELTRYLDDNWVPVIEKDVDGGHSLPLRLDKENPNLGRYSACRRVARTIYLGSAPTLRAAHRGIDVKRIKLGCVQPGESVATFGDALRWLYESSTYLYSDTQRYWYNTVPSVNRLAQDRAEAFNQENDVWEEIKRRLRDVANNRGSFPRVHVCPQSSGDVPDERDARLVILGPAKPHIAKEEQSPARQMAKLLLEERGSGPRVYRNTLVFLAPDNTRLGELEHEVRLYLAWCSIEKDKTTLNLDSSQIENTGTKKRKSDETINSRLAETYIWLLVPGQPKPTSPVEWQDIRLQGTDGIVSRAEKKLRAEEQLILKYGPTLLRMQLENIPLWRGDSVSVKQLVEDFAQYLYLPRLRDAGVLRDAIEDGVASLSWHTDTFAYAERWDEEKGRYSGLKVTQQVSLGPDHLGLVVKPDVATKQIEAEKQPPVVAPVLTGEPGPVQPPGSPEPLQPFELSAQAPKALRRFYGQVSVDALRLATESGKIAEAIVQHLGSLQQGKVTVTIEIHATVPQGIPEDKVRTVTENCRTLKFQQFGFEEE